MGMHFKLGLYEHQSAGAIQGLIDLIAAEPRVLDDPDQLLGMRIMIYEPAFSIIGDPHKRDPRTRQSADHSMLYIVATLLRKAYESRKEGWNGQDGWQRLMLAPDDYAEDESALFHPLTRRLMRQIDFRHGGPDYDRCYPDGIPTTVELVHSRLGPLSSGLVMYPAGHARCETCDLSALLEGKFRLLAALVKEMDGGGVYLNIGSAVVLPEVFLKCVTLVRNLGHPLSDITTANFDFIQSYRPLTNVVRRPTEKGAGHGYSITGHHELTIPLLAAMLICT